MVYGAVGYLRTVSLVMNKVKVTPIRLQTIACLELGSAKIGVKRADNVLSSLDQFIKSKVFYWLDSTITLGWIRGSPIDGRH